MKKLSLAFILALVSTSAIARWIKVDDNYIFVIYVDRATISKAENIVNMRDLIDLKSEREVAGTKLLSAKTHNEYDCKKEQWRLVASSFFNKNMGAGRIAYSIKPRIKWLPVEPDSFTEVLWTIACGKGLAN